MNLTGIKTMPLVELLELYKEKTGESQNSIAKAVAISNGQLSSLKSGTYKGDSNKAESMVRNYIENELSNLTKKRGIKAKDVFVKFERVEEILFDIDDAIEDEQMLLIRGKSGSGKTILLEYVEREHSNSVMITGVKNVTEKKFLSKLLRSLGGVPNGSTDDIYEAIEEKLRNDKIVLIDEANHLNYATLERLRSLWDATQRTFILAGTPDGISDILIQHRQIESRVLNAQTFYLEPSEVGILIEAFGFTCKPEYITALSSAFGGMTRKTAWTLEKWGKLVARGAPESIQTLDVAIRKMM